MANKTTSTAFTLGFISFVSMLTMIVGLGLCILKTPKQKSQIYITAAYDYINQASDIHVSEQTQIYLQQQAVLLLKQSLQLNLYDASTWNALSQLTITPNLALNAQNIAVQLQSNTMLALSQKTLMPAKNIALNFSDILHKDVMR